MRGKLNYCSYSGKKKKKKIEAIVLHLNDNTSGTAHYNYFNHSAYFSLTKFTDEVYNQANNGL